MSPERVGRLVDDHGPALVLYARQWSTSPEDIVQDAFLKLVAQRQPPSQPVAWLFRVVRNCAISASRAERRRHYHESTMAGRATPMFLPSDDWLDAATASQALDALPIEQREVIIARLWGGLTFEEIAEVTGTSSSGV